MHPRTLEEIWKFAKSQDAIKSGPHLADLLEIFTSFTDEKSSVEILNKMREAPAKVCSYRQTAEDPETGTVMVLSKSVDHPKCPNNKRTWRVKDYFSTLIVKPHTTRLVHPDN